MRDSLFSRIVSNRRVLFGGSLLLLIMLACVATLGLTLHANGDYYYDLQHQNMGGNPPQLHPFWMAMGTTKLGQSLLGRCLLGGVISLSIGVAAAAVSVALGVVVGVVAGYRGGWIDGLLMRSVDVLYGLPYILMVILLKIALERPLQQLNPNHLARGFQVLLQVAVVLSIFGLFINACTKWLGQFAGLWSGLPVGLIVFFVGVLAKKPQVVTIGAGMTLISALVCFLPAHRYKAAQRTLLAMVACGIFLLPLNWLLAPFLATDISSQTINLTVMFLAIGLVSWLTMARVIRGQVLSLRSMPFIDAARAVGTPGWRIFLYHLLPNLIGPITIYATLTIPSAILQESTLSFLGIGIQDPLPTWGSLASQSLALALNPIHSRWWLLVFPCSLLAITLLSLNFLGDGLREVFDPKRRTANV